MCIAVLPTKVNLRSPIVALLMMSKPQKAVSYTHLDVYKRQELHDQLAALDALPLADLDAGGLLDAWRQARAVCSRAWRLHFAVMYPVFAVHEWVLAGMAAEGISALEASALIEVPDHTIALSLIHI